MGQHEADEIPIETFHPSRPLRDELPNDSGVQDTARARREHAHAWVISIERLNIAGLIVP